MRRSSAAMAAVWATAACLPASVEPLFSMTTGLRRVTSPAISRNFLGLLMLSRYMTIALVSESSARYSKASVSSISILLPSPMTRETPKCSPVRMYFMVWVAKLPVWAI